MATYLHWSMDPLLYDEEPTSYNDWETANSILRTSAIGVVINNDLSFVNIYGIMVRKIDFVRKGARDRIIARFPFLILTDEIRTKIQERTLPIAEVARDYFYRSINKTITAWRDIICKYLEQGALPFPLFRCAQEIILELSLPVNDAGNIPFTSARGEAFTFPTSVTNKLAYLCGICNGDGNLRQYWIIVADETKEHIEFVTSLLNEQFSKNGKLMKTGGAWIVKLNLLWTVRLFNFLTNQAIDEPKYNTLREPLIFQKLGEPYRSLYWRGAFDADGSFKNQIVFCSISENYSKDFQKYLEVNDIESHFFSKKGGGFQVNVLAKDKMKIADLIGSLHPKKSQDFIRMLQNNIQNLSFHGFNSKRITTDGFFDFSYLPKVSIIGLGYYFRAILHKTSIFSKSDLQNYKNDYGITIRKLLKHLTNTNQELMPFLQKYYNNITFRSASSHPYKLPIRPSDDLEKLVKNLIPTVRGATLYHPTDELFLLQEKILGNNSQDEIHSNRLLSKFLLTFGIYKKYQVNISLIKSLWREKINKN